MKIVSWGLAAKIQKTYSKGVPYCNYQNSEYVGHQVASKESGSQSSQSKDFFPHLF
jgi:hypothetical protein